MLKIKRKINEAKTLTIEAKFMNFQINETRYKLKVNFLALFLSTKNSNLLHTYLRHKWSLKGSLAKHKIGK